MPTNTKTAPAKPVEKQSPAKTEATVETQAPVEEGVHIGDASIEVNVRPIEPRGALIGLADVKINVFA